MNATQKREWVKALRSGKYKQGKETLYKDGKYCCLGVYLRAVKHVKTDSLYGQGLPEEMGCEVPVVDGDIDERLAELNDGGKSWDYQLEAPGEEIPPMPFEVIAGFIQENIETA